MVFSSLPFLFLFAPVFFLIYGVCPRRWKNWALFAGSLVFYAVGVWQTPGDLLLMAASWLVTFLVGLHLHPHSTHRRLWLILGLSYHFFWLFLFKYAGFFWDNLSALWGAVSHTAAAGRTWEMTLPLGISFYTFQAASYLIDLYRRDALPEESPLRLALHLFMFPHLTAGPIVRYPDAAPQLRERQTSLAQVDRGLRTFVLGLGYKVLLANRVGALWSDIAAVGYESISTPLAWMGAAAYSLQIYFDFYGYSLMAMGLGEMMGLTIPENFRQPYLALSMTDFWRRWHITLGRWFRDYLYIPLGGNRRGEGRTVRNLLAVWLFTGLWHGASWNFVLWGLLLFVLLNVERAGLRRQLEHFPALGHLYMLFAIPLSWTVFAITDIRELGVYFHRLFPIGTSAAGLFAGDWLEQLQVYGGFLAVGLLFCTDLPRRVWERIRKTPLAVILLLAIFWAAVYCLYRGLNDPFLYFRF